MGAEGGGTPTRKRRGLLDMPSCAAVSEMRRLAGALESAEAPVVIEPSLCRLLLVAVAASALIVFADAGIGNA